MTTPPPSENADLVRLALEARGRAYAPYSHFLVGAALRTADGRVFTGVNVENASYGLSVCAERTAVVSAVAAGARDLEELAVATTTSPPAAPCGVCRQTLAEFARDLPITLVNDVGERRRVTLAELLPHAFHGDDLERARK
jgi:cytidine deaminase